MNRISYLAVAFSLLILNVSANAQENNEARTLLGNEVSINTSNIGFFVAPAYGITSIDESTASLFSLRGGFTINDKISFGAFFNTSLNEINPVSETIQGVYLDYWSVGGFAEYTIFSKNMIHLTFPLYIGYGEVQMDNETGEAGLGEANFFQIEPSALLEINLHKYVRFNLGAGYRIVGQMEYRNFTQSEVSGLTGYAGLKFGLFK